MAFFSAKYSRVDNPRVALLVPGGTTKREPRQRHARSGPSVLIPTFSWQGKSGKRGSRWGLRDVSWEEEEEGRDGKVYAGISRASKLRDGGRRFSTIDPARPTGIRSEVVSEVNQSGRGFTSLSFFGKSFMWTSRLWIYSRNRRECVCVSYSSRVTEGRMNEEATDGVSLIDRSIRTCTYATSYKKAKLRPNETGFLLSRRLWLKSAFKELHVLVYVRNWEGLSIDGRDLNRRCSERKSDNSQISCREISLDRRIII